MAQLPVRSPAEQATHEALVARCQEAIAALDHAIDKPARETKEEADVAQRAAVRLRDALIEQLRRSDTAARPAVRAALDHANMALSLLAGVEYPATGLHRQLLEQARATLQSLFSGGLL